MTHITSRTPKYAQASTDHFLRVIRENSPISAWPAKEDGLLRALYPDFATIVRLLPHKDKTACIERCYELGLNLPSQRWSDEETLVLRKNYQVATKEQLLEMLPGRSWPAIKVRAFHAGLFRRLPENGKGRKLPEIIDRILLRAAQLRISTYSLDEKIGAPGYFSAFAPATPVRMDLVCKAVAALGGEMHIRWPDAEILPAGPVH